MNKLGYIYAIKNKINNKIYIGQTTRTPEKRLKEHILDSKNPKKNHRKLYKDFNLFGIDNFYYEVIERCLFKDLYEREIYWINKLNTYHDGYNETFGGSGKKIFDYDELITFYNNCNKEIISLCEISDYFNCSIDTMWNVLNFYNLPFEYNRWKSKKKSIYQYSLDNCYIQKFLSLADAVEWLRKNNYTCSKSNCTETHISECAKGKRKTASGFIWSFTYNGKS